MTVRNQKIEARIQRLVAEALVREVSDPRLGGLLSVTRVQITPDHRDAKVFISALSTRPDQTVQQGLNSAQKRIQSHVTRGLSMKFAPRLTFHLDNSLKKQAEILAIMRASSEQSPADADTPLAAGQDAEPSPKVPAEPASRAGNVNRPAPITVPAPGPARGKNNQPKGSHE